jgi:hypothetical protein
MVLFGLTFPLDEQREFFQKMALILIPIVAGAIVTKFTTDSWQVTKEKLEIKRTILSDYEQSYKQMSLLIENFVYRIIEAYIKYAPTSTTEKFDDYDNSKYGIETYIEILDVFDDKPKQKLQNEFKKFNDDMGKASLIQNRFVSSVRLYFSNESLDPKRKEIENSINDCNDIVLKLINCNTSKEAIELYNHFKDANKVTISKMKDLEDLLVLLKFRQINL